MVTLEQKLSEFQKIIEEKVDNENKLLIEAKKAEIDEDNNLENNIRFEEIVNLYKNNYICSSK